MKRVILIFILFTAVNAWLSAQSVGIGTLIPNSSAILDIESLEQGILVPRMSGAQRDGIANPADGLLVYVTTDSMFYCYDGEAWVAITERARTLMDTDKDTRVMVEVNPDDDIIRFHSGGMEYFRMDAGRLEILNTGRSVYLGDGAGANDDFLNNENVALGDSSMFSNTTGYDNVALGKSALYSNTIAYENVALGHHAMYSNVGGLANVAVGTRASYSQTGGWPDASGNVALGHRTLEKNVNGSYNVAAGYAALFLCTGDRNTALGRLAMYLNTSGSRNVASGDSALYNNTTGNHNTALGHRANVSQPDLSYATAIGAGAVVDQSNTIVLGRASDKTGIGTSTPGTIITNSRLDVAGGHIAISNDYGVLSYNNASNGIGAGFDTGPSDDLHLYAGGQSRVTIDNTTGNLTLHIGDAYKTGGGSWAAISDRRLKQDIAPYQKGLEEILRIQPRRFRYIAISGYNTDEEHVGVIAQELQEVSPEMITHFDKDGEAYLGVDNSNMVYMLINAVKQLKAENDALKIRLSRLEVLVEQTADLPAPVRE